ncbi:MAG: GPW/gp25 family protein [Rhodobacteraceae bacterium]|nr:GPW/gp25 family protein [Paracoccaceae bacterium]
MTGMSRSTGRQLDLPAHLAQSVADILTTPVGSRVMRRDYGSDLPRLIDAPLNGETLVDLYAATAAALAKWEPRIRLTRVQVAAVAAGALTLMLDGEDAGGAFTTSIDLGTA